MKRLSIVLFLAILVSAFTIERSNPTSKNGGVRLSAMLTGAAEVPGPGDPNGSGYAELILNQGQGTITYELSAEGIAPARAAHIHVGAANVAGPIVVHLAPPTEGTTGEMTIDVDPELIKAIRKNPENYYVNVHNADYSAGAIRGQLSK